VLLVILLARVNISSCEASNNKNITAADDQSVDEMKQHKSGISKSIPSNRNGEEYNKRIKANRERWKRTFSEIKSIVVDFKPEHNKTERKERTKLFDQWKLFSEQSTLPQSITNSTGAISANNKRPSGSRQRFDGFQSWEKLLQQWVDDSGYFMNSKVPLNQDESAEIPIPVELRSEKKTKFSPRPAKAGEAILPHTDIGDKSKKIWIVTTASLPWMTGTAVNPLLRAAFMTAGRKEAGGKVTLMLPWLEGEADRDKIYGKERSFDTSEEQEEWIRSWLKDTAGLKEASEVLNIAWYIGRHETLENSIYSMGDITAMIPVSLKGWCCLSQASCKLLVY